MKILIGFILVFLIKFLLPIGTDESEHLHFSYLVSEYYVPFKDFYQHHLPLIWDLFSFSVKTESFLNKVVLFITSLYLIFDNSIFNIKGIKFPSIFLMIILSVTVKFCWLKMSKNHKLYY